MAEQDLRDAAYPQESGAAEIVLLVIAHAVLAEPIRLTDAGGVYDDVDGLLLEAANSLALGGDEDGALLLGGDEADSGLDAYVFAAGGRTYISAPIDVIPPGESDEEPRGRLVVPNVDQRIGEAVESIHSPATCTVTVVLDSDPNAVLGGPYELLELRAVRGDAMAIEGDLLWPQLTDAPWPKDTVRPSKYRAAFRALA